MSTPSLLQVLLVAAWSVFGLLAARCCAAPVSRIRNPFLEILVTCLLIFFAGPLWWGFFISANLFPRNGDRL